jgi:hypothetical protein
VFVAVVAVCLSCCVPSMVGIVHLIILRISSTNTGSLMAMNRRCERFLANNAMRCVRVTPETCFVVDNGIVQRIEIVKSGIIAA